MLLQDQRKLEHRIEVIIVIGSIILGFFLGYMEIASWTF